MTTSQASKEQAQRTDAAQRAEAVRQDLTIGLHTVTEFNQSIRYADTKAAALAAVQALAMTVLTAHGTSAGGTLSAVLFALCLLAILISTALLAATVRPRLFDGAAQESPNRTAFHALAGMHRAEILQAPALRMQHDDVWRQAANLATIAVAKYRWLHRATLSTFATFVAVLLWLGVTTWLR